MKRDKWVKEIKKLDNENLIEEIEAQQNSTMDYKEMLEFEVMIRLLNHKDKTQNGK